MKHGLSERLSQKTDKLTRMDFAAFFSIAAAAVFLIWRCQRGFGFCDEHGFLSEISKLISGDAMIADEWHVAQLSFFLYLLPFKLFTAITGSTDGIILFSRYLLIALKVIIAAALYRSFRKHGLFALLSSLSFILFFPWLMMAVTHHSLGMLFVEALSLVLLSVKKPGDRRFFLAGVFGACAVLCNPLLAAFALVYCILSVIYSVRRSRGKPERRLSGTFFSFRSLLPVLLGIAVMATAFFVFLFSRTTLSEVIENFPMLFTDPEYSFIPDGKSTFIFSYISNIKYLFAITPFAPAAYFVLIAVILFDKKRFAHRLPYATAAAAVFLFYIISIFFINPNKTPNGTSFAYMTVIPIPLIFLCVVCYLLTKNKDKHLFFCGCVPAIIFAVCDDIASDVGITTAATGMAIVCTFGIILIGEFIKELVSEKNIPDTDKKTRRFARPVSAAIVGALCVQIVFECIMLSNSYYLLAENDFSEDSKESFPVTFQDGPFKGIMTKSRIYETYYNVIDDIAPAKERDDALLLSLTTYLWIDLYMERQTPSFCVQSFPFTEAWFKNYDFVDRLLKFYELHPDKYPNYIYVLHSFFGIEIEEYTVLLAEGPDLLAELAKKYNFTFEIEKGKEGYLIEITYL